VPWCDQCDRFWNPNSMAPDGSCPRCGDVLAEESSVATAEGDPRVPWHFWVLVVATTLYLVWRLIQGVPLLFP